MSRWRTIMKTKCAEGSKIPKCEVWRGMVRSRSVSYFDVYFNYQLISMDRIVILPNGKPSVSTRVSISWPPALPAEDSSVLVLSSCPYKSKSDSSALPFLLYLDLRLSLPLSLSSKITWAFAGIRHTLQLDPHPRFRWDHIIDSRNGMEGSDTVDEGETVVSHNHEVETGIGWNPETNRVERYEELWR